MSGMTLPRCCLSTDCPVSAQGKPRWPGVTSVTGESLVTSTEPHNSRQHVTLNIDSEDTIRQDDNNNIHYQTDNKMDFTFLPFPLVFKICETFNMSGIIE